MNKKVKIAMAAVSAVMVGSMALGMVGCQKNDEPASNGKYGVTLNINIGDAANRSISFRYGELLSGTVTLPDGKKYTSTSLKPAWQALSDEIQVDFKDVWQNPSKKLENASIASAKGSTFKDMDIITDGAANVSKYSGKLIDLNQHLDKMPNYKKFLDENPIVRLSLTSNTTNGAMYYAPYFDGNNDIEKYSLFKTNWIEALLDDAIPAGHTGITYKAHGEAKLDPDLYQNTVSTETKIESWMGTTDKWKTEVLDKDGKAVEAGITVNYDAVKTAMADTSAGIGKVYADAMGSAYTGNSGNIVDIMNALINGKQGEVNGVVLMNLLREYIKVAYYLGDTTTPFYTQTGYKLSDIFCGYSAAWDVDLYAAIGRVLVTNPQLLKSGSGTIKSEAGAKTGKDGTALNMLFLLSARQNNMQRMSDTLALVAQLYGIRGLESKNFYSYIDGAGELQDPRGEEATYDAYNQFHNFWLEGLIYTGASGSGADQSWAKEKTPEALSCYDYVNTQTPTGYQKDGTISGKYDIEDGYNYTPIITPVAKWNDGTKAAKTEKYMRFTESWRTTKDTGFSISKEGIGNNAKKLEAALRFIDYMFSNDGQILMTYGPKASSADAKDGFWYNREATAEEIEAGTYFEYKGQKLYSTVNYGGAYQPEICEDVYLAYFGKQTSNGNSFNGDITAAGEQMTVPTAAQQVKKDAALTNTYCIDSRDRAVSISKAPADCYVVEYEGTNSQYTGKKFIVDKNGWPLGSNGKKVASAKVSQWNTDVSLNYSEFARGVIGSALPIGNKLQSFEFQLTSKMGRDGALVVDTAIKSGVIKHTENVMTDNPWYTVVPTMLPYTDANDTALSGVHARISTGEAGNYFTNNKNADSNLLWNIIKYGYSAKDIGYSNLNLGTTGNTTAAAIINALEDVDSYTAYLNIKNTAWGKSKTYYATLSANK